MSTSQLLRNTFKPRSTCIFLSGRADWSIKISICIPCSFLSVWTDFLDEIVNKVIVSISTLVRLWGKPHLAKKITYVWVICKSIGDLFWPTCQNLGKPVVVNYACKAQYNHSSWTCHWHLPSFGLINCYTGECLVNTNSRLLI